MDQQIKRLSWKIFKDIDVPKAVAAFNDGEAQWCRVIDQGFNLSPALFDPCDGDCDVCPFCSAGSNPKEKMDWFADTVCGMGYVTSRPGFVRKPSPNLTVCTKRMEE